MVVALATAATKKAIRVDGFVLTRQDLNLQPSHSECDALPIELLVKASERHSIMRFSH